MTTEALKAAREALVANDTWHNDYDEHGGYPESELCEQTASAIRQIDAALAEQQAEPNELAEWRKLRDPVFLHANLLRGLPAKLDRATFLHLAGDAQQQAEAAVDTQIGNAGGAKDWDRW